MTKLSRRGFLKGSVALGAGFVLYRYAGGFRITNAQAGLEVRQLRIVHTNDHHSRIEPAPNVSIRSGTQTATRNLGGVARRKTIFDQIAAETPPVGVTRDTIFLDAGDVFQGTLYFNQFLGAADQWFYNRLGYSTQAIGNHEFDRGDQVLANYIAGATYPIVAANITAAAGSPLAPLYQEVPGVGQWGKRIVVDRPNGAKVGIFGLTTVETANISSPSADITFSGEYGPIANAQAAALKAAGANIVVALTHIGYEADKALAAQAEGVNVIVGGHSHTPLLPDAQDGQPVGAANVDTYPQIITGADGNPVVVVQDWEWAKWVGDITIGFDAAGIVTEVRGASILPVWAEIPGTTPRALLPGEGAEIAPDPTFQTQIVDVYKPEIAALEAKTVGTATANLSNALSRSRENALGNFLADAIRAKVATFANPNNLPVVCILNGGGIRTSITEGEITVGEVLQVQPFGNTVGQVEVSGKQLKAALENGVSALQPGAALDASRNPVGSGRFPNVSGLRYTVNPNAIAAQPGLAATATQAAVPAQPGRRITEVEVLVGDEYVPLVMDDVVRYRVATLSFIIGGGDGYSVFSSRGDLADPTVGAGVNRIDSGLIDADVTIEYIQAQPEQTISPELEGRITVEYLLKLPIISNLGDRTAAPAAIAAD
jgi:5'-nucleotidase/UDP-sugar diphosphatase